MTAAKCAYCSFMVRLTWIGACRGAGSSSSRRRSPPARSLACLLVFTEHDGPASQPQGWPPRSSPRRSRELAIMAEVVHGGGLEADVVWCEWHRARPCLNSEYRQGQAVDCVNAGVGVGFSTIVHIYCWLAGGRATSLNLVHSRPSSNVAPTLNRLGDWNAAHAALSDGVPSMSAPVRGRVSL